MKKLIKVAVVAVLCIILAVSVLAARDVTYENDLAKDLRELGLFSGVSQNNFDLERAPTRTEVLVMLIRVLGVEDEAKSGTWSHPFTDVPEWANPYVGYAYQNGLTQGVSKTKFGTGTASATTYLTFMLRALGYSDTNNLDFKWDNPFDLAKSIGIMPACVDTENFWRADIVSISYAALGAKLKNSDKTLADKLIEAGTFTTEAYREYYHSDKLANAVAPVRPTVKYTSSETSVNTLVGDEYYIPVGYALTNTGAGIGAPPEHFATSSNSAVATARVDNNMGDEFDLIITSYAEGTATITIGNTLTSDTLAINVTAKANALSISYTLGSTSVTVPEGGYVDVAFDITVVNNSGIGMGAPPTFFADAAQPAYATPDILEEEYNPYILRIYGNMAGSTDIYLRNTYTADYTTIHVTVTAAAPSAPSVSHFGSIRTYIKTNGSYSSDGNFYALYNTAEDCEAYLIYDCQYNLVEILCEFYVDGGTVLSFVDIYSDGQVEIACSISVAGYGEMEASAFIDKATLRGDSKLVLNQYVGSAEYRSFTAEMLAISACATLQAYDVLFVNNANPVTSAMLGFTSIYNQ